MANHETNRMLLEEVRTEVRHIHRLLVGNGELGVMGRLDRLEQRAKREGRWGGRFWDLGKIFIAALAAAVFTVLTAGLI